MIRLALNATSLLSPLTGIGQYTLNLALELSQYEEIETDFFYSRGWNKKIHNAPSPHSNKLKLLSTMKKYVPFAYELRRFWQMRNFNTHVRKYPFDVYHEPNYLLMPFDGPTAVTVHDLSWINYPEMHPVARVKALNKHFAPSLQRATLIITDSAFIRQEVIHSFSVDPTRIEAIPLGVEHTFTPKTPNETQVTLRQYGLQHGSYFLAVGTLEPRKNLQLALDAYRSLPMGIRKHYPLVLAGMKGWHTQAIERVMQPLVNSGEIRLLGYIPRTDLATITAGAATLVYPSVYEGFGLPPLEAMACAVPPIVSNTSSLPEVVSTGGITVNPSDAEALRTAMQQLVEDPTYREQLGRQALARAQHLTWQQCAKRTYQIYQRAISLH